MTPPNDPKITPRPGPASPARPGATAQPQASGAPAPATKPAASGAVREGASGRVVHDERGNAVWQWLEHTIKIAIDTTSLLLKKLETPELKVEDTNEHELRIADVDPGGGYDPYNVKNSARKPSAQKKK